MSEESGKFEETLFYLSDFMNWVIKLPKISPRLFEPAMLLLIGLVVAGLALASYQP